MNGGRGFGRARLPVTIIATRTTRRGIVKSFACFTEGDAKITPNAKTAKKKNRLILFFAVLAFLSGVRVSSICYRLNDP
jgi:hypothetical protein